MKNGKPKVAIVHDWLVAYAGADRVVDCMHHVFPDAPIYTLVYDENNMPAWFKDYDIRTTYLQKLPFATKLYRAMLPWMPRAFEALDLSEYDMVISSCSSCSKGVITRPDAVHICYCHTPTRYVWDFYYTYRNNANALVRAVMPGQMLKLRQWDKCAADRVDYFIANSHYIAKRIKKYSRRDSDVIYPCVHINEEPFVPKEDFYLVVGRFTWYKRIDLAVAACTKLNKPLIVIGGGNDIRNRQTPLFSQRLLFRSRHNTRVDIKLKRSSRFIIPLYSDQLPAYSHLGSSNTDTRVRRIVYCRQHPLLQYLKKLRPDLPGSQFYGLLT